MKRHVTAALAAFFLLMASEGAWAAGPGPDYAPYAAILKTYVQAGQVDYASLKAHEKDLDQALEALRVPDPDALPEPERKAYYINVYNAWTLKLIVRNYPVASIRKIGPLLSTPWQIVFIPMGTTHVSLDYIEHQVLRPQFEDPRIHFAINCASKGCPPLLNEPYLAERLDAQLDQAAASFINDPAFNTLTPPELGLSSIFDWFSKDFGGPQGVIDFVIRYAPPNEKNALVAARQSLTVRHLKYDWALNGK